MSAGAWHERQNRKRRRELTSAAVTGETLHMRCLRLARAAGGSQRVIHGRFHALLAAAGVKVES